MWPDPCVEARGLMALGALLSLCDSKDQAFYSHLTSLHAELALLNTTYGAGNGKDVERILFPNLVSLNE